MTRNEARAVGTDWLRAYLALPNYANNLLRSGFTQDDLTSVSDRLFDAIIAWGDEEAVLRRVNEHLSAGADHVCVQVLTADPTRVSPRAVATAGRSPSLTACGLEKHVGAVHSGNLQIHLASDPVFGSYAGPLKVAPITFGSACSAVNYATSGPTERVTASG